MKVSSIFKHIIQNTLIKLTGCYLVKMEKQSKSIDCVKTIQSFLKYYHPVVVYDIGSNSGAWAHTLTSLCDTVQQIVFFEPQKKYHTALKNINVKNASVLIYNCGLGDKEENVIIQGGNACASFLAFDNSKRNNFNGMLTTEKEEASVKILDSIYYTDKIPKPDLIKIDVQGYELNVLKGAAKVLSEAKYLIVELSVEEFYEGQHPLWQLLEFLHNHNYTLIDTGYEWRINYDPSKRIVQIDGIFANRAKVQL